MRQIKYVCLCILFFWIGRFCHTQTAGFQITKVLSFLPYTSAWETEPITPEIRTILKQPFTFLSSGGQCYAFLSEDRTIVLKLFKMHHVWPFAFLYPRGLPGSLDLYRLRFLTQQKCKLEQLMTSAQLAWNRLRQETGLITLQLNGVNSSTLTVIDPIHIAHTLDLTRVPFALQYYAENPMKQLRHYLHQNNVDAGKEVIAQMISCLRQRTEKGIGDLDPALRRNMGLLADRAILIDIGSFIETHEETLFQETRRLHRWLAKRSATWKAFLENQVPATPTESH